MSLPARSDLVLPQGTATWNCESNCVVCLHRHMIRYQKAFADARRLRGHQFYVCATCQPPTYFLAIYSTQPDPHVTCYAIAEACYREYTTDDGTELPTNLLLYLLRDPEGRSYHPYYQGPR